MRVRSVGDVGKGCGLEAQKRGRRRPLVTGKFAPLHSCHFTSASDLDQFVGEFVTLDQFMKNLDEFLADFDRFSLATKTSPRKINFNPLANIPRKSVEIHTHLIKLDKRIQFNEFMKIE